MKLSATGHWTKWPNLLLNKRTSIVTRNCLSFPYIFSKTPQAKKQINKFIAFFRTQPKQKQRTKDFMACGNIKNEKRFTWKCFFHKTRKPFKFHQKDRNDSSRKDVKRIHKTQSCGIHYVLLFRSVWMFFLETFSTEIFFN